MSRLLILPVTLILTFSMQTMAVKAPTLKVINKKLGQHRSLISKSKTAKGKLQELEKMLNYVANLPMNNYNGRSYLELMNLKTAFNLIDPGLVRTGHCDLIKAKTIFDLSPRGIASQSKKWPYAIKQSFFTLQLLCPKQQLN